MNATLIKALFALGPACMLLVGSAVLLWRERALWSFLQLLGAGCLTMVVLAHIAEGLHLLSWMNWGLERSMGHYLAFCSAVLGIATFPTGYLFYALTKRHTYPSQLSEK